MTRIFEEDDGVLVWEDIESASKLKESLTKYVPSHNLSLNDLKILKITETDLNKLKDDAFTELQQLSKLELKWCKLSELPITFQLPSTLTELHLEENKIIEITTNFFGNLPLLEVLTLQENSITTLQNGVFSSLSKLKRLTLVENNIDSHNPAAFKEFTAVDTLEEIIIDGCYVHHLEAEAFQGLKNIKTINLSRNNRLSLLPTLFSNLTSLEDIEFCRNYSTNYLEETHFEKLCNLVKLNLSYNAIEKIHKHAFRDLKSLTELYLGDNNITALDEYTFQETTAVKVLDLQCNKLEKVPSIANLTNLKCLYLQDNEITILENKDFNGLDGLLTLKLGRNKISQIEHETFKNLESLIMLALEDNKLENIKSESFRSLKQLRFLNLSNNGIKKLELGCFQGLNILQTLDIGRNSISDIKSQLFEHLTSLTTLALNSNGIKCIEADAFSQLKQLKSLDLSSNEKVDFNVLFNGLDELQFLDLHDNQLKRIYKLSEGKLPHLLFLNISGCNIDELSSDVFERLPSLAIVQTYRENLPQKNVLIDWQSRCSKITFINKKDDYY